MTVRRRILTIILSLYQSLIPTPILSTPTPALDRYLDQWITNWRKPYTPIPLYSSYFHFLLANWAYDIRPSTEWCWVYVLHKALSLGWEHRWDISSFDRNYSLKRQFHDTNADITIKPRQFLTSCNNFHSVSSLETCEVMVYKSQNSSSDRHKTP